MFNVTFTEEDYNNKKAEVLKGRDFSEMGEQVPTFSDKTFEEALPVHFLNEEGIKALKEVLKERIKFSKKCQYFNTISTFNTIT